MMKFFKSSDDTDEADVVTVLSKDDVACFRAAYRYFDRHHLKGMPVAI